GVGLQTVRAWENDQSEPRANTLQRVAGILGVSLMWLLAGEGEAGQDPGFAEPAPDDMRDLLLEIRSLRSDHARIGERLGRLEKRLRLTMAAEG
ncbi:MAG: helix-turn-helix domain-containing protein, partial [Pseudomonadota bacterium]